MVFKSLTFEDLYDEFTFGRFATAIHDYLARAMNTWSESRITIAGGDARYDPKNYLGQGLNDLVPTKTH